MKQMIGRWVDGLMTKLQGMKVDHVDPHLLPLLDRCRQVYGDLDVAAFMDYTQTRGHGKSVEVVHNNIEACIADIASHITSLESGGYIVPAKVNYVAIKRPINRFFISNEGFYLTSVRDKVQELVDVMSSLCKALDEAKRLEMDTSSYNLRMLNSLLHVMLEVGYTLQDITLEIRTHQ